jgi:hypothetical protein
MNYCANSNDRKYGYTKLPTSKFRLREKEIAGSLAMNEESKDEILPEGEEEGSHAYGDLNLVSSHMSRDDFLHELNGGDTDTEKGFGDDSRSTISIHGDKSITLDDFEIKSVIGKGTFGKVFLTVLK